MPAEDQIIIEFSGVDASQQGLTDYLKGVEEELLSIGKNNPQFLKGAIQGIKETTAELGKQAIAAGEDKKKVDFLVGSLNNLAKGVAGGAAKQATAEFQKFGNSVTATAKESEKLTSQLRRLRDEIAKLPEGSARFTELSIEAAKLQDKIGDVGERIRVLSSDTFAIDAVVDGVRGLTAAFTIAQSASALFGKENEDLQKALLKVQAATGLLIGVQEIANQVTGQGAAKLAIIKGATAAYTFVTEGATLATQVFRGALLGLGAGIVIAGIVAIYNAITDSTEAQKEHGKEIDKNVKKYGELKEAAEGYLRSLVPTVTDVTLVLRNLQNSIANLTPDTIIPPSFAKDIEDLNVLSKNYFGTLKVGVSTYKDVNDAINRFNQAIKISSDIAATRKELEDLNIQLAQVQSLINSNTGTAEDFRKRYNLTNTINDTNASLKALQDQLIALGGDPAIKGSLDKLEKEIEDIIRFTPNKKNEIREIIKEAFDLKGELPKVPVEIEPRLSPSGISLDVPESDKVKLGQKISALFQDDAVQQAALDSAQTIFDTIFTISNENRAREEQAELDTLHRKEQQELTSIQKRVDNGLLTAEQGKIREEALRLKFAEKEKAIKLRQFNAEKQAALAQAFINSALAATKIIAQLGVAAAPALIAQGVALAAQIAIIASQKPPAFKKGTRSAPGGMALVGEEGAELMHVPQGARIVPHAETMKVLSGHPDTDAILSRFNIPVTSAKVGSMRGELRDFDFNRFESIISRHSQKSEVHVDKNGVITIVSNGLNEREYYGNRYSFK